MSRCNVPPSWHKSRELKPGWRQKRLISYYTIISPIISILGLILCSVWINFNKYILIKYESPEYKTFGIHCILRSRAWNYSTLHVLPLFLLIYQISFIPRPFLISFLLPSWPAIQSYRPHLEERDPIWGDDWSHSPFIRRSPS